MTSRFKTINIGVCDCFWTPPDSEMEIYLGLTKGGVEVEYEQSWHEITADQYGESIIDGASLGEAVTAKVPMLETDKQKIKMVAPLAREIVESGKIKKLTFGSLPGKRMQDFAGRLRMHPISSGESMEDDVTIYRAINVANFTLPFKIDSERIIEANFIGIVKPEHGDGAFLFEIGDPGIEFETHKRVVNFYITPINPEITANGTQQFSATAVYDDGTSGNVTTRCVWTSSDESIAKFDTSVKGRLTGTGPGTVVVSATYVGYSSTTNVKVTS